jgi:hypothetical protein
LTLSLIIIFSEKMVHTYLSMSNQKQMKGQTGMRGGPLKLRPGDRVRVKSPHSILATLDDGGRLDKMPFMPEMLDACGKVLTVVSRADKTCDTATQTGGRRLFDSVHLAGQRCDGSAHGGCQAACLNFWKEAWLEPISQGDDNTAVIHCSTKELDSVKSVLMKNVFAETASEPVTVYSCQATELPTYTRPLSPWSLGQYWRDVTSNKVGIVRLVKVAFISLYSKIVESGFGYRFWVAAYDFVQILRNRPPWPRKSGTLNSTPTGHLDLEVGEYVRVKPHNEILKTLDGDNSNRGLLFDTEMVRFCGTVQRVHSRVEKIINEGTGEMLSFGNPCIILEDVWCSSEWSDCRRFCPRSIYHYWREIWLERVEPP